MATARNALKLKEQVDTGKYIPEEVRKKLEGQTDLTEEEKEICRRSAVLIKRRKKIAFLKTEAAVVELDRSIKTTLNNSNPQIMKCCDLLTELLQLSLEPLHLIKQPDILLTIRKLRKYVGPSDKVGHQVYMCTEAETFFYFPFISIQSTFKTWTADCRVTTPRLTESISPMESR